MNVKFKVTNQRLTRTSFEQIVEKSNNYLFAEFEFSDDWKDKTKNVYVSQNGSSWYISQVLDNVAQIPIEVLRSSGFKMYLVARDEKNNVVITTNVISLGVEKTGEGEVDYPFIKSIESETLELSRTGNIVKIEIPDSYATDEELQNAIKELEDNVNDNLTNYYDKEEINAIKKAINDNVASESERLENKIDYETETLNNKISTESIKLNDKIDSEVNTINTTITGVKNDLNSRVDNLSETQTKALEKEILSLENGDTIVGKALNDDLGNEIKSTYASSIESELNSTNYKLNIKLKNALNGVISQTEVDFPTESSVVNLAFNSSTNILTFTLRNGNTTQIPLSSIIRGLATEDYVVEKITASETSTNEKISAEVKKINTSLANKVDKEPKKLMFGCKGHGNTQNAEKYILLGTITNTNSENDDGFRIHGVVGGFMVERQSLIDVVANRRETITFNGRISASLTNMDIAITSTQKVYLVINNIADNWWSYNLDLEAGIGSNIEYTGEVLNSVDGTISARLSNKVFIPMPYVPLNGGLKANSSASTWGVQIGNEVASFNDTTGGSFKFRRDCPKNGQMSLVLDGSVYVNEGADKVAVENDVAKLSIQTSVDSTPNFYNILDLKLLDKNSNTISASKVYLPKAQEVLHTSTFIFDGEDSVCTVEGELAGKSREEKLNIFPYNLMKEEEVQLQDSNGADLEGTDTFIVMPNLWVKTSVAEDNMGWSITFANQKVDEDYVRAYDDDSINEVLIAKYKANDDGTYLRSRSGDYPKVNLNQTNADSKLPYYKGQKIDSLDYRVKFLYDLLAVCYIENRNTQNVYVGMTGYSWGDGNLVNQVGEVAKNGSTLSLGSKLATGEITTFNDTEITSGKRPCVILGVENPYGLIWENLTGVVHNASCNLFAYNGLEHMTPSMMTPSDSNQYYKDTGIVLPTSEGWQKTFANYRGHFYPTSVGGSSSKGVGDYYHVLLGWKNFLVSGSWSGGAGTGLFCLVGHGGFGNSSSNIGFRLSLKR